MKLPLVENLTFQEINFFKFLAEEKKVIWYSKIPISYILISDGNQLAGESGRDRSYEFYIRNRKNSVHTLVVTELNGMKRPQELIELTFLFSLADYYMEFIKYNEFKTMDDLNSFIKEQESSSWAFDLGLGFDDEEGKEARIKRRYINEIEEQRIWISVLKALRLPFNTIRVLDTLFIDLFNFDNKMFERLIKFHKQISNKIEFIPIKPKRERIN